MSYNNSFISLLITFLAASLIILAFFLILSIVMYVFESIGLFAISRRRKLGTSAFAWIPLLNIAQLGKIADDATWVGDRKVTYYKWITPLFAYAGLACCMITNAVIGTNWYATYSYKYTATTSIWILVLLWVGIGLTITGTVFTYISLYYIYRSCSDSYIAMLVLSILFSVLIPFFLFAVRNKDNGEYYDPRKHQKDSNDSGWYTGGENPAFHTVQEEKDDQLFRQVADGLWEAKQKQ